jgi:hypothetical protein
LRICSRANAATGGRSPLSQRALRFGGET